jgi:hypothetical protein
MNSVGLGRLFGSGAPGNGQERSSPVILYRVG